MEPACTKVMWDRDYSKEGNWTRIMKTLAGHLLSVGLLFAIKMIKLYCLPIFLTHKTILGRKQEKTAKGQRGKLYT